MSKRIISLNITTGSYSDFVNKLLRLAINNQSSYTCVANVHMCIEAYDDNSFADIVNNADLVAPDGLPLAKALKFIYGIQQDRVAGMDLLPDLLRLSEIKKLKVFFFGGTEKMLDGTREYIARTYPSLSIAGCYSPPFRALNELEQLEIMNLINASGTNFVFVILGCPKQEKWMALMKGKIHACMIGVGGALPVMIGLQKRAPKWMQRFGLEWFHRLTQEPRRLFARYAYTNTKFIFLLLAQKLRMKKF